MDKRAKNITKLVVYSTVGIILFLVPVSYDGGKEIILGILCSWLKAKLGTALVPLLVGVSVLSGVITLWHKFSPIGFISRRAELNGIFSTSPFWTAVRCLGAAIVLLVYFNLGPDFLKSADTGGNMLFSILPTCAMWYLLGGLFLPLLTDYGCVDLIGSLFSKPAYTLFRVPGRAMIDCISSWIGSSVCGTYLTITQYEGGFYSAREAVIIISNFSLLSISFCSLIASMLGLDSMFGKFYATIVIAGLICAFITPRLWPICSVSDTYNPETGKRIAEEQMQNMSGLKHGVTQALARAESAPNLFGMLKNGLYSALNLTFTTVPVIMAFGTLALAVANYTEVFNYLGAPLGWYLELFNVPQATKVGSAMLVGFADQFVPVIIGADIPALSARFLLGTISILQVLYVTDVGTLILTSKVLFKFWQMFVVFLERILICIPIVIVCEYLFGIL